jgi:hypothetical protein
MEDALRVTPNMTELPFGYIGFRNISIALCAYSSPWYVVSSSLPISSLIFSLAYHALQNSTSTPLPPLSQSFNRAAITGNASERLNTGFIVLKHYLWQ